MPDAPEAADQPAADPGSGGDPPPVRAPAPGAVPVAAPAEAPAPSGPEPSARRSRLVVALIAAGLAVVLMILSLVGTWALGWWPADEEPAGSPPPSPTAAPDPFAGTPAEDFAEGADGIVLPEAEAVGDFTEEEVAEALEQVREALIAARLDSAMLIEHDPDPFLALLAADHQVGRLAEFDSGEFADYATQIADDATLASVPPRVDGQISYELRTVQADRQVLDVVARFVWVYAFETPDLEASHQLVVVRDELLWRIRGEPWLESSQGLWLSDVASQAWGVACEPYQDGLLSPEGGQVGDLASEADTIFDPAGPIDRDGGC